MNPNPFVVEPLDGSYSHCGPPCFFGRFAPVPEGTTTATSTRKPTGQLNNRQIFLRPSNDGPPLGILDNPAQCNQFVTKSIGLRPVLGGSRRVALRDQLATGHVDVATVGIERQPHRGKEGVDGVRERSRLVIITLVGRSIGRRQGVEEEGTASGVFMSSSRTSATASKRSCPLPPRGSRSPLEGFTRQGRQIKSARQAVEPSQCPLRVGGGRGRHLDRRAIVRAKDEQSVGRASSWPKGPSAR